MTGMTDRTEDLLLQWLDGGDVSADQPGSLLLGLAVAPIADDGVLTTQEVTGGSYTRDVVTFGAPSNGTMTNTAPVDFPNMPDATVTYVFLADENGNVLFVSQLPASIVVTAGSNLTFDIGDIVVSLS